MIEPYQIQVRVYNALVSSNLSIGVIRLYLLVRSLDTKGSGWCRFDIERVATTLKRSVATIRDWLREIQKLGFFQLVNRDNDIILIRYRSLCLILADLGIQSLGAAYEIDASELINVQIHSTAAELQYAQKQSRFLANQAAKKKKILLANVETILNGFKLSGKTTGNSGLRGRRGDRMYVGEDFITYGASQSGTAKRLNCSTRTVQRHVSKSVREAKNLKAVDKVQLAQSKPEYAKLAKEDAFYRSEGECQEHSYFKFGGQTYRNLPNVYAEHYWLIPCNALRKRLKRKNQAKTASFPAQEAACHKGKEIASEGLDA